MKFNNLHHLKAFEVHITLSDDPQILFSFGCSKITTMVVWESLEKFRGPNFLPTFIEKCPNLKHLEIHNIKLQLEWFLIFVEKVKKLKDSRGNASLPQKTVITQQAFKFCKDCSQKQDAQGTSYCLLMTQKDNNEDLLITS